MSATANWHQVAIVAHFQVMACNAPLVRKALQFACGNALVTETAEQAKTLAFGANRHRVVALDGTLFQPSGLISGGGTELKSRAKKWDEQTIRKLKEEQRALFDRIHALQAIASANSISKWLCFVCGRRRSVFFSLEAASTQIA